jgi:tetratricopeptide (TPR) repeat protein
MVNPEAYHAYLRGREDANSGMTLENAQLAVEMLQRAVRLDPNFADAYAELARAHSVMYHMGFDRTEERITRAKEALDRASRLNPDSAEAYIASGWFYYFTKKDYDLALREFAQARKLEPNNSEPLWGSAFILRRMGDFEGAAEGLKAGLTLSPRFSSRWAELGLTYVVMRRYPDAEKYLDRAISIAPDETFTYVFKSRNLLLWRGEIEEARKVIHDIPNTQAAWERVWIELYDRNFEAALRELRAAPFETFTGWPADNAQFTPKSAMAGLIYLFSGQQKLARSSFEEARILLENELRKQPDDQRLHSCLGMVLAGLGLKVEAIREGKRAVEMYPVSKDAAALFKAALFTLTSEQESAIQIEYLLSTRLILFPYV